MRKIAYFLIVAGFLLMLYPTYNHWAEDKKQQELVHNWEALNEPVLQEGLRFDTETLNNEPLPAPKVTELATQADAVLEVAPLTPHPAPAAPKTAPAARISAAPVAQAAAAPQSNMIGIIKIDAINLKLPVVEGVKPTDIKNSPGHIPGTALPGEIGNAAIAGHRSYSYGRMFNRLEQLEPGHTILFQTGGHNYEYIIFDKKMVEPTDMSVLNHNKKDKILTLITCDEAGKQRLILQARLK